MMAIPLALLAAVSGLGLAAAGNFCGTTAGCIYPYPADSVQGVAAPGKPPPTLNPAIFITSCLPAGHPACAATVTPALARLRSRLFTQQDTQSGPSSVVQLQVTLTGSAAATPLQLGVNESYVLEVPDPGPRMVVTIRAPTEWGALWGLESFAQSVDLIPGTAHGFFPENPSQPAYVLGLWPPARIADAPRTAWRGLLVDTSRHFLSVPTLERVITAMSMAKMNALHFHVVDGDGWALCLDSLKHVCETRAYRDPYGAWSETSTWNTIPCLYPLTGVPILRLGAGAPAIYTPAQLRHIVAFATARGVRVIPEFDLPGHIAGPLCAAEPSLCVAGCAPDPSNPRWWAFLKAVVAEMAEIFPDTFVHGGADEFHPECWLADPKLAAWARRQQPPMTTAHDVLDYFHVQWQQMLLDAGRRPMFWDEFFWVYDAPTPTRKNLTILPGTSASLRGITGDRGPMIKTEYAGDLGEWEQSLAAGIPSINTGISEMWYLDRVAKICDDQPGGCACSIQQTASLL